MNKQKGLAPILIILLIAVIVIGGYLLYQKQTKIIPVPQPLPSPIASDETANWKMYTSKLYGYSIRYPLNMRLMDCEGQCNYEFQIEQDNLRIIFGPQGLSSSIPLSDFLKLGSCVDNQKTIDEIKIGTTDAYYRKLQYSPDNLCLYAAVPLKKKDWLLTLQGRAGDQEAKDLFDQILSTFKFTQ